MTSLSKIVKKFDYVVKFRLHTLLFDNSLKNGDKHKPRFISNLANNRHLETHTVDAIFTLRNNVGIYRVY